jgi:hypothetical protein
MKILAILKFNSVQEESITDGVPNNVVPETTNCLATVRQRGTAFTLGVQSHSHQPCDGIGTAAKVKKNMFLFRM